MSPAAKTRFILIAVALLLLIAAILLWQQNRYQHPAPDEWPYSLEQSMYVPIQANYQPPIENAPQSRIAWEKALDTFRSATNTTAAVNQTAPLLEAIWHQWPNSTRAVKARLFYLETLKAYEPDSIAPVQYSAYIEQAMNEPQIYFSDDYQAASQSIAVKVIQRLIDKNKALQAWQLCTRLRWASPRIDRISKICQQLVEDSPKIALSPQTEFVLNSPLVVKHELPRGSLSSKLAQAIHHYLSHPFEAKALENAILELYRSGFSDISQQLILEMLQIDPMSVPRVEVAIGELKSARQ